MNEQEMQDDDKNNFVVDETKADEKSYIWQMNNTPFHQLMIGTNSAYLSYINGDSDDQEFYDEFAEAVEKYMEKAGEYEEEKRRSMINIVYRTVMIYRFYLLPNNVAASTELLWIFEEQTAFFTTEKIRQFHLDIYRMLNAERKEMNVEPLIRSTLETHKNDRTTMGLIGNILHRVLHIDNKKNLVDLWNTLKCEYFSGI